MVLADVDISQSIQRMLTEFFAFIPEFLAAIAILIIGYFIARVIGNVVARILGRAGLDTTATSGQTGAWVRKVTSSPSRLVGKLAFWAVFLGVISLAVSVLGINALTEFVGAIFAYLPNVIAAVLIFLVAGAIAAGVATLATKFMGDTPTGKVVATVAPILVMTIATFMILEQLKIAHDIVVTTYTLLLGAVALGSALAFGLGGRDVAARMLEGAYQKGQQNKEQIKQDFARGKEQAQREAQQKKDELERGQVDQDLAPRPQPATTMAVDTGTTQVR
jgi:Conserved TM helix